MSLYSHNFYAYPYFKIYGYKKGTMCLFIHIISMYTHIFKIYGYKKGTSCLFICIISMYTHILTIKRNYVNNEMHISPFLINYDNLDT